MGRRTFDADKLGAFASGLCAVHCALTGLLLGLLPVIGATFLTNPFVEASFISAAVIFGCWAAWRGFRQHKKWGPMALMFIGLGLVFSSHAVLVLGREATGHAHTHSHENPVLAIGAVLGGLTLVAFHIWNHRLMREAACACGLCTIADAAEPDHNPQQAEA
ncbi:MAG: MerC domain-containing protein [Fimbriimonadaceae bacterium]|nr:MerC domain-containing protein [Fimbriimonadaceae bacterium]QYK55516.1 MAG: MerC domain-containing protein [Fimbriimonadaceae bacterium]